MSLALTTFITYLVQEPMGLPKFFDVSLPACHGLRTPADLHILALSDASVLPSVYVKTLGIRNKLISKLYQHFRERGLPYGLQDSLCTLTPFLVRGLPHSSLWSQHSIRVGGEPLPDRDLHPARYAKLTLAR